MKHKLKTLINLLLLTSCNALAFKTENENYERNALFFGFSEVRRELLKNPLYKNSIAKKNNRFLSIDEYNRVLTINEQMENIAHYDRLIDYIKNTSPYSIKRFENFSLEERDLCILWFEKLKQKIDYFDVRNLIQKNELKLDKGGVGNKFFKNLYTFQNKDFIDSLLEKHSSYELVEKLNKWALNPESFNRFDKDIQEFLHSWVYVCFFRRVSKLGIDFANEQMLDVYFPVGHVKRRNFLIELALEEKKTNKKIGTTITTSELRHCFRKNLHLSKYFHFFPFDYNEKGKIQHYSKDKLEKISLAFYSKKKNLKTKRLKLVSLLTQSKIKNKRNKKHT